MRYEPYYKQLEVKTNRTSSIVRDITTQNSERKEIHKRKTQKTKKRSNTDPTKKPGMNSAAREV